MRWMQASVSADIERPIEEVWELASGIEHMTEWMRGVSEPRMTSEGGMALGATFASKYTYRGESFDVDYEVTEYDPPRRRQISSLEGPFPFTGTLTLEAIEGGTPAVAAWRAALDAQIEIYRSDDSAYFRARAADLMDLRDRVVGLICGEGQGSKMKAPDAIYVARDLAPSRFLETDWNRYRGAALMGGSASSHVAILARARGVPLLIGVGGAEEALRDGAEAILAASNPLMIDGHSMAYAPDKHIGGSIDPFRNAQAAGHRPAQAVLNVAQLQRAAAQVRVRRDPLNHRIESSQTSSQGVQSADDPLLQSMADLIKELFTAMHRGERFAEGSPLQRARKTGC